MQEQSHKSEMGAALRGDFERLRARGGGGVMTTPEPSRAAVEPVPEPAVAEIVVEPEPADVEVPVEAPAGPERPTWFGRLRDRL